MLIFVCAAAPAGGQGAGNPFEMKHRLAKTPEVAGISGTSNPFDVVPHRQPGAARVLAENTTKPFRPSSFLPRYGNTLSDITLFGILVTIFTLLTLSVAANRKAVGKAWRGFLNDNGLTVAQRESSGLVGITPYLLLYGNFLLNAGMFLFLTVRTLREESFNNLPFFFIVMACAAVLFLSKHLFLAMAGWLFPVSKEVRRYNFLIIIFNCVLGLFLMPFNFLLAFSTDYQELILFWTLGLIVVFYLYRAFRSSPISTKFLADNQFHFLLYLCAVEIAPVILVLKLAMIQTG